MTNPFEALLNDILNPSNIFNEYSSEYYAIDCETGKIKKKHECNVDISYPLNIECHCKECKLLKNGEQK